MKILSQFAVIFGIYSASILLDKYLHIPLPTVFIGFLLVILLLVFQFFKDEHFGEVGHFLAGNLSLFLVPFLVQVFFMLENLKSQLFNITLFVFTTTLVTFLFTAFITGILLKLFNK